MCKRVRRMCSVDSMISLQQIMHGLRGWAVVVKWGDVEGGYLKQGVARAHSYGEV